MNLKDIPIEITSNEEETESTTISNLIKQWPNIDETEIETEPPISQPKCKFYFSFAFWWEKERERTREIFLFAKHDFFLSKIIQGILMYLLMIGS